MARKATKAAENACYLARREQLEDSNKKSMNTKKYTLSIPEELLKNIKKLANDKGMTINSYILLNVSQGLNK